MLEAVDLPEREPHHARRELGVEPPHDGPVQPIVDEPKPVRGLRGEALEPQDDRKRVVQKVTKVAREPVGHLRKKRGRKRWKGRGEAVTGGRRAGKKATGASK